MGKNGRKLKGQMIRHQLFTLVTLLGCVAPWLTPRHFPVHRLLQGKQEPMVMPWVAQKSEHTHLAQPLVYEDSGERQQAGRSNPENSTVSVETGAVD